MMQLGWSLLGKYPISLGRFTVFPLLGVSYNMIVQRMFRGQKADSPFDYNQFGLLAGAGGDYYFNSSLFLRCEVMFSLRFPSKASGNAKTEIESYLPDVETTLGMGPHIKLGLGYRF